MTNEELHINLFLKRVLFFFLYSMYVWALCENYVKIRLMWLEDSYKIVNSDSNLY